jgi:multidrug efflux system outer membrane protein
VAQAQAGARQLGHTLPELTATASAGRQKSRFVLPDPIGEVSVSSNSFALQAAAAYEVDVWKRLGSQQAGIGLDAAALRDDVDAIAVSLAGEITEAWLDLRAARARIALLEQQLATNQASLEVLESRFRAGLLPSILDVYQQRSLVAQVRGQIVGARAGLDATLARVAGLVGSTPGQLGGLADGATATLPAVPVLPAAGVPADLLERRPDVRAARRRVEAADHRVAAAVADRLPALRLQGSLSLSSSTLADLIATPLWSLLGAITAPLFDNGRRAAAVDQQHAVVSERLAGYGQAMLTAMTEVEAALAQEQHQLALVVELTAQRELAAATLREARDRYREGQIDYLPVLSALQAEQRVELAALDAAPPAPVAAGPAVPRPGRDLDPHPGRARAGPPACVDLEPELSAAPTGARPHDPDEDAMSDPHDPSATPTELPYPGAGTDPYPPAKGLALALRAIAVFALLAIGVFIMRALIAAKPAAKREDKTSSATPVELVVARVTAEPQRVTATGTVVPARQVLVGAEVGGRVVWMSPELVPGGRFKSGQPLLRVDARDYKLALAQQNAQVTIARTELEVEKSRKRIAEKEWQLLGEKPPEAGSLALRDPQMLAAEGAVRAAESGLQRQQLAISKTGLTAPFNAMVLARAVDQGPAGRARRGAGHAGRDRRVLDPGLGPGRSSADHRRARHVGRQPGLARAGPPARRRARDRAAGAGSSAWPATSTRSAAWPGSSSRWPTRWRWPRPTRARPRSCSTRTSRSRSPGPR